MNPNGLIEAIDKVADEIEWNKKKNQKIQKKQ